MNRQLQPEPQNYRTLENPITKRKIRLPVLIHNRSAKGMTLLEYTNLYLADPQASAQLATPSLKAATQNLAEKQPLAALLLSPSTIMESSREKEEQLRNKLKLSEARNAIVMKSLRKYLPHNSSLTEGYRQQRKLLNLRMKNIRNDSTLSIPAGYVEEQVGSSSRLEVRDTSPSSSQASRTHIKGHQVPPEETEPRKQEELKNILTERQRIRQIIDGYESHRLFVCELRTQEQLMERNMDMEFGKVRAACGNILGDGYRLQRSIPVNECNELKRDMHEVSVRCQILSRSLRKKY